MFLNSLFCLLFFKHQGLYRGYGSTLLREIPFSIIQFPLYEKFKEIYKQVLKNNLELKSYEVAICGALAGNVLHIYLYLSID